MIRTLHIARRSLRAALTAGRHVVSAAISAHHRLLVRLYAAIDGGRDLRIRYTDTHGTISVRAISPRSLRATDAGHITVRAYDWRDHDDTNFRTDRIATA